MVPPTTLPQRFANDAAVLKYLAEKAPSIPPLPSPFQCFFEDDDAIYHATGRVEGVSMNELSQKDKPVVTQELLQHVATLRSQRSDTPGVPGETLLYPPMRTTMEMLHLPSFDEKVAELKKAEAAEKVADDEGTVVRD
ncbi:hypothetical protein B0T26DRAFT_755856 [Lasiosphaeria miniovina]|uniref:Uncharacterized protein n=1 Tax=Lasiosphaeria miniovina TaxID=1954250 RepID=A0AA39ZZ80_9PEZI|nr:uncharacterized protein B0T26DRAFT_755856 [Lasiosphaeria miniovina]KAK0706345.1 hypothetical protein B0T26DRAFT_755856 [Lasiosphaeria miniovina]